VPDRQHFEILLTNGAGEELIVDRSYQRMNWREQMAFVGAASVAAYTRALV
jgi:hypothetical protein